MLESVWVFMVQDWRSLGTLGTTSTIFQAEVNAKDLCIAIDLERRYTNIKIFIFSGSQPVINVALKLCELISKFCMGLSTKA